MSTKQISQWRTVGLVVFACILLAAVLLVMVIRAGVPLDLGHADRLFAGLADAVVWLVAAAALKSSVEHLGRGGGVKGAAAALLTEAKPADPPPAGSTP